MAKGVDGVLILFQGRVFHRGSPFTLWHARGWKYEDEHANLQGVLAVCPGCLKVKMLLCPSRTGSNYKKLGSYKKRKPWFGCPPVTCDV